MKMAEVDPSESRPIYLHQESAFYFFFFSKYHKKNKYLDITIITIIVLKMEQFGFSMKFCIQKMQMEWHIM